MRKSITARQQLRDTINDDIAKRTKIHQAKIAALKTAQAALGAAGAPAPPSPLIMLAHGDSWFDYPLDGNTPLPFSTTDVIAHLQSMGNVNPVILNVSHHGDATTEEMSLPKQQRMIQALQDPKNWGPSGKPDALLFSGGGDDIAGDQFCIFLDYNIPGSTGLDAARFQGAIDLIEASYSALFAFRDRYAPGVPVVGHCYDFPIPNGVHPICDGPWLQPSLTFSGWTALADGIRILHTVLASFAHLLNTLAANPSNNFIVVPTQGTLTTSDWANELHPTSDGFKSIAQVFVTTLRGTLGRI